MNEIVELTRQIRDLKKQRDALIKKAYVPSGYLMCVEHGMVHLDDDEHWNVGRKRCRCDEFGNPLPRRQHRLEETRPKPEPGFKYAKILGTRFAKCQQRMGFWFDLTPVPTIHYSENGRLIHKELPEMSREVIEHWWINMRARKAVEENLRLEDDDRGMNRTKAERKKAAQQIMQGYSLEQRWNVGEEFMNRSRR